MSEKKEQIKITCRAADILPLDAIEEFQGNLKRRSQSEIEKIIKSITQYGFSFPFFIWQHEGHNYCLDGHGRIKALCVMRQRGYDLPLFPVAYIEADNEVDAKQKLLRMNSNYGQMTRESVLDFLDGIEVDFEDINIPYGNISLNSLTDIDHINDDMFYNEGEKAKEKEKKCPYCGMSL